MYSGWITVTVDTASVLKLSPDACNFFSAILYASTGYNNQAASINNNASSKVDAGLAGFLLHSSKSVFQTLLIVPSGTSLMNASRLVGDTLIQLLPELGSALQVSETPVDAYLIDWSEVTADDLVASPPSGLMRLGCAMDWVDDPSGYCLITVPAFANYFSLDIAQTFMKAASNIIQLELLQEDSTIVQTVLCGGSKGFSGQRSQDYQCSTFSTCAVGYINLDSSVTPRKQVTMVRLTVPQTVAFGDTCAPFFAAVATFSHKNTSLSEIAALVALRASRSVDVLVCTADFSSVNQSAVCDGVLDCADGQDEATCFSWYPIERGWIFFLSNATATVIPTLPGSGGLSECRKKAVANGTTAFAVDDEKKECVIYSPSAAAAMLSNPLRFLVERSNFTLYGRLEGGPNSYSHCTAALTCSGHGKLLLNENKQQPSGVCTCVCDTLFTGENCESPISLTVVGSTVVTLRGATTSLFPTDLAQALMTVTTAAVVVTCDPYQLIPNQTSSNVVLATWCRVREKKTDQKSLFDFSVREGSLAVAVNSLLQTSEVVHVTLATLPEFQYVDGCTTNDSAILCGIDPSRNVLEVVATVVASVAIDGISLYFTEPSSITSNRRAAQRAHDVAPTTTRCSTINNTVFTPDRSGCVTTVCRMQAPTRSAVSIGATMPDNLAISAANDPCFAHLQLEVMYDLKFPVIASAEVHNVFSDYSGFLFGGWFVVVASLVLCVASIVMKVRDVMEARTAVGRIDSSFTPVQQLLCETFCRMDFYTSKTTRSLKADLCSVGAAVLALNVCAGGIFILLFFYTSHDYDSNVVVVLEMYNDENCAMSRISPTPTWASLVDSTSSRLCLKRTSTGTSLGSAIFSAAFCDSDKIIFAKIAPSETECNDAGYLALPANSCVRASSLFPWLVDNVTTRIQLSCATVQSAQERFNVFRRLQGTTAGAATATVFVQDTPRAWRTVGAEDGAFHPRLQHKRFGNVTTTRSSDEALRVETSSDGSSVFGTYAGSRLVVQVENESFIESSNALSMDAATSAMELDFARSASSRSISQISRASGPQDGDYPVGFIYNGFNSNNDAWQLTVGAESARYYGAKSTAADIGAYFGIPEPTETSGFTVSMFLRATSATTGFAFAVTDGYENLEAIENPLLETALDMLEFGSDATSWPWPTGNIYSSFHVDGPSATFRFMYINPSASSVSDRIVELGWDLELLQLTHALNGLWHHVAVILRVENGLTKAQLIVDGETSESVIGWNLCPSRNPMPIQQPPSTVNVTSEVNERFLKDGVLYTGYFNGGIAHLQFEASKVDLFDIWRSSTSVILQLRGSGFDRYFTFALASFVIGATLLFVLVWSTVLDIRQRHRSRNEFEALHCAWLYKRMWTKVHRDVKMEEYAPSVPLEAAREWM